MTGRSITALLTAFLALYVLTRASAQDDKVTKPASKDAASKRSTIKVEKPQLFRIELSAKGVLDPMSRVEVAYRPNAIVGVPYSHGPLTVRSAAAHGATVKKGEILATFDTRKIDQAISQIEFDLQALQGSIGLATEEQPLLEKSVPVEMESTERAKREADEDLAYFLKIGKPEMQKRADLSLKHSAFSLEYAREQLRQLEKMYKSNDLTEDTEQIILKRQRFMVEDAIYAHKVAEQQREFTLNTTIPRKEQSVRDGVVKSTMALDRARATLALQVSQKQKSLAKMRADRDRLANGLELLKKDRAAMTPTAPADGIVYYGRFHEGSWQNADAMAGKLVPDGSVMPDEVLMTIVQPGASVVRLAIDEKDAHLMKVGLEGRARLVFDPNAKVAARVMKVASIPTSPGKYQVSVELQAKDGSSLVPGMACTIKFVPYSKNEAIVVPAAAVHEADDGNVVAVLKDGQRMDRKVVVGHTHDGKTEIVSGLTWGEEIFPDRADKTPAKGGAE